MEDVTFSGVAFTNVDDADNDDDDDGDTIDLASAFGWSMILGDVLTPSPVRLFPIQSSSLKPRLSSL